MKFNKAITVTILLIASISLVSASPAELTIFPEESSTRINSFTSYEVSIENTGPVKDEYTLSSSHQQEMRIAPQKVELEPGQEETVNVWFNPDKDREEGRYAFTVTATSRANGDSFPVQGYVNVIREHDVVVNVDQESRTGCLGEEVTYNVQVTNQGSQSEEFELSTDYGELSRESVTLEDGETQTIRLVASSDDPVQENFNIVAASPTSYAQDIQNVQFNAEQCYASDVSITPNSQDVEAFTEAEYEVTVRNTGTREDNFVLSSSTGQLGDTEMEIDPASSESTTLTFTPQKLGEKTLAVTAKSNVESRGTATANVVNGMNMQVNFDQNRRKACEDEEVTYTASVTNNGPVEETYSLSANRGNLSVQAGTLESGETGEVEITVDGSQYEPGQTLDVELTVTAETFGEPVKTKTAELETENCWDLDMNVVPKIQSAGENRSVIYEIRLENTGTKENTYQLDWEGPEWIDIKPSNVTIASDAKETAYMYAGIPFEKEGQVKVNVTGEGRQVKKSQTVQLLINETLEDAIKDEEPRGPTGAFSGALSDLSSQIGSATNATRILISLLIGLALTAGILYKEW